MVSYNEDMPDRLYETLTKLPKKNLINLMWTALDEMQAYNGRSRTTCLMLAMGNAVESKESESGGTKYRIKSLAELKRETETMGL